MITYVWLQNKTNNFNYTVAKLDDLLRKNIVKSFNLNGHCSPITLKYSLYTVIGVISATAIGLIKKTNNQKCIKK